MVAIAPRYGQRLIELVLELDDRQLSLAENYRRVAPRAVAAGLSRPSYVTVRRLINAKRDVEDELAARREALRAIAADVATTLLLGRYVSAYDVEQRVRNARRGRT